MFSIGALSRATGVKIPTIRYYEEIGLIAAEGRTAGNQRRYSKEGLERLRFIRHARDLGLPIEAIRALVSLDPRDHVETHRVADAHLADIRARIAQLRRLEGELARIVASCDGGHDHECDILQAFAEAGDETSEGVSRS